jgi:hypothetical protein
MVMPAQRRSLPLVPQALRARVQTATPCGSQRPPVIASHSRFPKNGIAHTDGEAEHRPLVLTVLVALMSLVPWLAASSGLEGHDTSRSTTLHWRPDVPWCCDFRELHTPARNADDPDLKATD